MPIPQPAFDDSCAAVAGKREHLGSFATAVEAAVVRDIGIIWKQLQGGNPSRFVLDCKYSCQPDLLLYVGVLC
jgi:hypothetical protein